MTKRGKCPHLHGLPGHLVCRLGVDRLVRHRRVRQTLQLLLHPVNLVHMHCISCILFSIISMFSIYNQHLEALLGITIIIVVVNILSIIIIVIVILFIVVIINFPQWLSAPWGDPEHKMPWRHSPPSTRMGRCASQPPCITFPWSMMKCTWWIDNINWIYCDEDRKSFDNIMIST